MNKKEKELLEHIQFHLTVAVRSLKKTQEKFKSEGSALLNMRCGFIAGLKAAGIPASVIDELVNTLEQAAT